MTIVLLYKTKRLMLYLSMINNVDNYGKSKITQDPEITSFQIPLIRITSFTMMKTRILWSLKANNLQPFLNLKVSVAPINKPP